LLGLIVSAQAAQRRCGLGGGGGDGADTVLLTSHHGWTADQYQAWLARSLELLLLPER